MQLQLRLPVSRLYNREKSLDYLDGLKLITWRYKEDRGRLEEPGTALRYSQRENRGLERMSVLRSGSRGSRAVSKAG